VLVSPGLKGEFQRLEGAAGALQVQVGVSAENCSCGLEWAVRILVVDRIMFGHLSVVLNLSMQGHGFWTDHFLSAF
jgi:hypothetical protein